MIGAFLAGVLVTALFWLVCECCEPKKPKIEPPIRRMKQ